MKKKRRGSPISSTYQPLRISISMITDLLLTILESGEMNFWNEFPIAAHLGIYIIK